MQLVQYCLSFSKFEYAEPAFTCTDPCPHVMQAKWLGEDWLERDATKEQKEEDTVSNESCHTVYINRPIYIVASNNGIHFLALQLAHLRHANSCLNFIRVRPFPAHAL